MTKHSKQRDSILAFLSGRTDHPTAEEVFLNVQHDFPHISLATVYRNLTLLSELGQIRKISTGEGPDRFDAITTPHNHFRCNSCGKWIDLDMESIEYIDELAGKSFPGRVEGHTVLFNGICPECLNKA